MPQVASRHIRHSSELLFKAKVKQGFVPVNRSMTYATRLRVLLRSLYDQHKLSLERDLEDKAGPIERLQTLFSSQWAVTEDDQHLIVTVVFDRSWEVYAQALVRETGPTLDLILHHCEDYTDSSCVGRDLKLRYQGFRKWVNDRQLETSFYYPTAPNVTVDDITYMRKLANSPDPSAQLAAENRVGTPAEERAATDPSMKERHERTRRGLLQLAQLRPLFPEPIADTNDAPLVFDVAARNLFVEVDQLPPGETPIEDWINHLKQLAPRLPVSEKTRLLSQVVSDVQGNILRKYDDPTHGCLVLLRADSAKSAADFLARIKSKLTTERKSRGNGPFFNLAIPYAGLRRLGLSDDVLAWFPSEFRQGMAARNGVIGDIGAVNHPSVWESQYPEANWKGGLATGGSSQRVALDAVDFLITIQKNAPDQSHDWEHHPLKEAVKALERDQNGDPAGVQILHVQLMQRDPAQNGAEHFGFKDGVSQPVPNAKVSMGRQTDDLTEGKTERDMVPIGEALLGYADARGDLLHCATEDANPESHELFANGSYLVARKLAQDVAAFQSWAAANAGPELAGEDIQAMIVGRKKDGSTLEGQAADDNDFDFEGDDKGVTSPLHSHVRLANPRSSPAARIPRIFRRGFSYGPRFEVDKNADRGLMFMAYNGSIAEQYEIVQRWLNGGNPTGIRSTQNDLLTGPVAEPGPHWIREGEEWRSLKPPGQPFVALHWGLYAFAPAMTGVQWLIDNAGATETARGRLERVVRFAKRGERIATRLRRAEEDGEDTQEAWKAVLEDPSKGEDALAVWAWVAIQPKPVETPYGVLVARRHHAEQVLRDGGQRFSVRKYWHRIQDAPTRTGEHYISFDPEPGVGTTPEDDAYQNRVGDDTYAQASEAPNSYIEERFSGPGAKAAFQRAHDLAREFLDRSQGDTGPGRIAVEQLGRSIVENLSSEWFGIPASGIDKIINQSRFTFQPHPSEAAERSVDEAAEIPNPLASSSFAEHLSAAGYAPPGSAEPIRKVMIGSTVGFAAPGLGSIVTVLARWMRSGELAHQAEAWCLGHEGQRAARLEAAVTRTLVTSPVPSILFRTAVQDTSVGGTPVAAGKPVVIGLGAVALDPEPGEQGESEAERQRREGAHAFDWLFGGPREVNPHGCPARAAAKAVVAGAISAVLARHNVRPGGGLFLLYGAERPEGRPSARPGE